MRRDTTRRPDTPTDLKDNFALWANKDKDAKIMVTIAYSGGLENAPPERQKEALDAAVADMYSVFKNFTTDYVACLQQAFKWRGMSYKELAKEIGMNSDTVSRIINGKHPPTIESLALICFGLRLPHLMSSHIIKELPHNTAAYLAAPYCAVVPYRNIFILKAYRNDPAGFVPVFLICYGRFSPSLYISPGPFSCLFSTGMLK